MIALVSLANLATVIFAVLCLMTIAPQARGNVVKLWRLAVPACFAAVEAFVLLAGVFDASMLNDAEWLLAAVVGLVIGRMRGWSVPIQVDQQRDLIRQRRSADGVLAAIGLVLREVRYEGRSAPVRPKS